MSQLHVGLINMQIGAKECSVAHKLVLCATDTNIVVDNVPIQLHIHMTKYATRNN